MQNRFPSLFVDSGKEQSSKKSVVPQENITYQDSVQRIIAKDNADAIAYIKNNTSFDFNKSLNDDRSTVIHAAVNANAVNILTFLLTGEIIKPVEPEQKSVMITLQKTLQKVSQPFSNFVDDIEKTVSQLFEQEDSIVMIVQ